MKRILLVGIVVLLQLACTGAPDPTWGPPIRVERVPTTQASFYYRWCDGKHLMFANNFGGAAITVVPNDPRCAVEQR